jgi:nitrite reductase/ring-hydroxylating ferredoxin subunit
MRLCAVKDVSPGEMRRFDVRDEEILVVNLLGQFYCLEARCSHAGAPLYEGSMTGEILTCPWHYSQFNIKDGLVLRGPAKKPLKFYRTEIKDGQIFIEMDGSKD